MGRRMGRLKIISLHCIARRRGVRIVWHYTRLSSILDRLTLSQETGRIAVKPHESDATHPVPSRTNVARQRKRGSREGGRRT